MGVVDGRVIWATMSARPGFGFVIWPMMGLVGGFVG